MKAQILFDTEERPQLMIIAETAMERTFLNELPEGEYEAFKTGEFTERMSGYSVSRECSTSAIALRPVIKKPEKD